MKTKPEIPNLDARRARAMSAKKPWLRLAGKLRHLREETVRVNRVIEEEFGRIKS